MHTIWISITQRFLVMMLRPVLPYCAVWMVMLLINLFPSSYLVPIFELLPSSESRCTVIENHLNCFKAVICLTVLWQEWNVFYFFFGVLSQYYMCRNSNLNECSIWQGSFYCGDCADGFMGNQSTGCHNRPGVCPDGTVCDINANCVKPFGLDYYICEVRDACSCSFLHLWNLVPCTILISRLLLTSVSILSVSTTTSVRWEMRILAVFFIFRQCTSW